LSFNASLEKTATMTVTQPTSRFGVVDSNDKGLVSQLREKPKVSDCINMGYFIFQPNIFSYLSIKSVLEEGP
jgi:glucose-1-phosphate cytidylyltransferase